MGVFESGGGVGGVITKATLDVPVTYCRNSARSSLLNERNTFQNHWISLSAVLKLVYSVLFCQNKFVFSGASIQTEHGKTEGAKGGRGGGGRCSERGKLDLPGRGEGERPSRRRNGG